MNRLPFKVPGNKKNDAGTTIHECHHPKEELMSKEQSKKAGTASRRKFLTSAAVATAGAATLGFPMIAKGQAGQISMRWQSTWPAKDIFHEYASVFVEDVFCRPGALPAHRDLASLTLGDHGKAERRSAGRGHRSARQELAARSRPGFLGLFLAH